MWQTLIVVLVVGVAALWLARHLWHTLEGRGPACGCGDAGGVSSCGCGQTGVPPGCAGCPSLSQLAPSDLGPPTACRDCDQASRTT